MRRRSANVFARRMIVPPHREGGQAQFVEAPISACDCDELAATLDWAVHHLDQDLTVAQLAERARMSPRTFARRFCAAAGTTPLQWLLQQRVLAARRMLESSDLSVDTSPIDAASAASTLRMHFRRIITGTTPHAHRAMFPLPDASTVGSLSGVSSSKS
jgi:transcriptional regulator GlxA family with amidase domain